MARELSILIPARNEEFLARTVQDILDHIEADTEIIVVLDGEWAHPNIPSHERVVVCYLPVSIGQRAATNLACRLSSARYVMKVDAHCAFRQGFDKSMIKAFREVGDDVVMVPTMRNLHAFNWVCSCGFTHYQDKGSTCPTCGKEMNKDIVWIPKKRPESRSYCFDATPHFQYFNEYTKRPEFTGNLTESMSIQGSCFMVTREKYWDLSLSDESFGSWGSQGIEVACKLWLSGGRVIINHRTWYAHMFRTKEVNNFGFPYPQSGKQVDSAKKKAKELFFNNAWQKQTRPLSWLVEKFWPVPGWNEEQLLQLKQKNYVVSTNKID